MLDTIPCAKDVQEECKAVCFHAKEFRILDSVQASTVNTNESLFSCSQTSSGFSSVTQVVVVLVGFSHQCKKYQIP